MIIRKLFKFENAHIVRGCSTVKCRSSIHGHSYKVELLFASNFLDNGQMVYDFGLMKQNMKDLVESFDHAIALWRDDDPEFVRDMKKHSARWVELPVSPSAEQFSRVIFVMIEKLLSLISTQNGEKEVRLESVIVHETATGYAQCFVQDAHSKNMGEIKLEEIVFSPQVLEDFKDKDLFEKIKRGETFLNPASV
ncbi:6-carboxytetrahydropterin synthase [Sulfurimonas sediminis]|uniref:6-carboxy-5,6,7,8-tetrahydropterin synthase n=1 Tax=Sulfurimonas sediminis TaxID=2590020 RepID=A0A7M1B6T3_9BACT|nr:6-carboxytetrahydropterin synthase [Sulfurimonas sediminis]QOP44412.1 6-carboxytetrahydropterin synthase [Sulfurimonas sediminis]